jgi:hypothetical protein
MRRMEKNTKEIELVAQRQDLAPSEADDCHQVSLTMSPMGGSIARFAAIRQPDRVYGMDSQRAS